MNKTQIPYQQTGYFSKLIIDYLDENESLKPFYNETPNLNSFQVTIDRRKQHPINRSVLVEVLIQQNARIEVSSQTEINIQNLKNDNCFTVTTGHQLSLFTGPLYFIYKIISTINLAKELKLKYPENEFVPVYWMATEDHDFEEINYFNLLGTRYELDKKQDGVVGKMNLDGVEEILSDLKKDLGDRKGSDEVLNLFSKFYSDDKTFTESTRAIANHLFGKYGLVIIDGDDAQLKGIMEGEFEVEIVERKNHYFINETSNRLKNLKYKVQLQPREINLFYLQPGLRERIIFEENKYKVLNTDLEFSQAEIIQDLKDHPERYSPNAPLRCLYQEKILPNLAYIGGGGELAYWFQLKEMFKKNQISFPVLVVRNSVLFMDGGSSKRLSKLGLESKDLFKGKDELIKEYLKNGSPNELDLSQEEIDLVDLFEGIETKAGSIDQSLQPFTRAEMQKSLKALKRIEGRLLKAEKKKQEVSINQIKKLKEKLFPNNSLQERHDNLISILLFYGQDVIEELMCKIHPLDKEFALLNKNS